MNSKLLIPLTASFALMAACSDRNNDTGVGGETSTGTPDTAETPPADPNVTPGTPVSPAENPPADTPPDETPPPPPNQ